MMLKIRTEFTNNRMRYPRYAHDGDSGFDLQWNGPRIGSMGVIPGKPVTLGTGLWIEIPEGWEIQVRSKSGLASQGIVVLNSPGTVDSSYRGEIKVILFNHLPGQYFELNPGDKIAQAVLAPVARAEFIDVDLMTDTTRGDRGFGSTGR